MLESDLANHRLVEDDGSVIVVIDGTLHEREFQRMRSFPDVFGIAVPFPHKGEEGIILAVIVTEGVYVPLLFEPKCFRRGNVSCAFPVYAPEVVKIKGFDFLFLRALVQKLYAHGIDLIEAVEGVAHPAVAQIVIEARPFPRGKGIIPRHGHRHGLRRYVQRKAHFHGHVVGVEHV